MVSNMKSCISLNEVIDNTDRHFGSAIKYYPCTIINENGDESIAMFTTDQIAIAIDRSSKNKEDVDILTRKSNIFSWISNIF